MKDPIFSTHPNIDLYYRTSDGNAFFTKHPAQNHAKTLQDQSVRKVTKTSIEKEDLNINVVSGKDEAKTQKNELGEKAPTEPVKEDAGSEIDSGDKQEDQPKTLTKQVNDVDSEKDSSVEQDDTIEDSAADYNQAISDYMEKFGEAPFEGAELKKIRWAVQFNKKLTKPE